MRKKKRDRLSLKAIWLVEITRADGRVERKRFENLIVGDGMDWLAQYLTSNPGSAMAYTAVGTGGTDPTVNDTALEGEVARNTFATNTSSNNVWITVTTFAGAADSITSVALTEAGVFNAATGGTMFQRLTGTIATLGNSDFLKLTIETTIGSKG